MSNFKVEVTRIKAVLPIPDVVLHLHEQLPDVPTYKYTPPGTWRDNDRDITSPVFNIEHHGFIACLGSDLRPLIREHVEVVHFHKESEDTRVYNTGCELQFQGIDMRREHTKVVTCHACLSRNLT